VRQGTDIFRQRHFAATGGFNSLFFLASFGIAGHQLRQAYGKCYLTDLTLNIGSNKGLALWVVLPASFGYLLGVHTFGDAQEVRKLSLFGNQYSNEFKNYKEELYYS
jgi:hypothetical protein